MDADALFAAGAAALRVNRVAEARALFARAGEAGSLEAAVIHCNLVASTLDWEQGLGLLRRLSGFSARCRRELEFVEAMAPGPPPAGEVVSEAPHLTLFRGFFTEAECRYLSGAATPMLPLQVLRYRPGGEYKPHFDAIPGFGNQRIWTMIVWLNEVYEGGETMFMKKGEKLKGRAGDALLFRNALPDGRRDPDAGHAGLPVTQGEKLIASRWIRARPFEPPVGGLAA